MIRTIMYKHKARHTNQDFINFSILKLREVNVYFKAIFVSLNDLTFPIDYFEHIRTFIVYGMYLTLYLHLHPLPKSLPNITVMFFDMELLTSIFCKKKTSVSLFYGKS